MRTATITRTTKETDIALSLKLDGTGVSDIHTQIGFFDHMLTALTVHAGFDLSLDVKGDLHVDAHHTVEDTGIALGQAFAAALGSRGGIARYGNAVIPMDDALAQAVADISGRPYLVFDASFSTMALGAMETQLVEEFWYAFATNAGVTLHLRLLYGKNDHHKAEALFKAAAHALRAASAKTPDARPLSTKGVL